MNRNVTEHGVAKKSKEIICESLFILFLLSERAGSSHSEHRFYVRHLYQNFQEHFKGENQESAMGMSPVKEWNTNRDLVGTADWTRNNGTALG